MNRPQVTDEMLERAKAKVDEAQKAAIEKHSRGAFESCGAIVFEIGKQLIQLEEAAAWDTRAAAMANFRKQLAQIGQLAEFGLASMETWDE
jgi:hypothetical protein